jgi:phosphatidate cytidylyltransferase
LSNILQRLITGFFFVVILVGGMIAHPLSYVALFTLITVLGLIEFYRLIERSQWDIQPQIIQGVIAGVVLFLTNTYAAVYHSLSMLALNMLTLGVIFISELYRKKNNPFGNIAFTLLGVAYVALPFAVTNYFVITGGSATGLANIHFYPWILFSCFMIIWANDSWAYLSGRWFGKRKLFERISPGKTWEGSAGGAVVALLFSWIMSMFFKEIDLVHWLATGAILIVTSTLGDLVESMLKRSLGVKDSGTMLPGHGGILDRFDGMFISLPVIWAYFTLFV